MAFPGAFRILRRSVEQPPAEAGLYCKMFDPPTVSPGTPELVPLPVDLLGPFPRANPVPAVMAAAGFQKKPNPVHVMKRDLMHGDKILTWDEAVEMVFFVFRDKDNFIAKDGTFPAATVRCPRGCLFHGQTQGHGPPPHTIHWHGIEPTPINDGVGHCSMEIGNYTYQWQPNFIGTYFYHCHRNTLQHFEFGLYGLMIFDPPDAFYASIASVDAKGVVTLNDIPIGNGNPEPGFPLGRRRTAANLPGFPGFVGGTADPDFGINFANPHAFTVPYDIEALWVLDDRDSVWSEFAPDPRAYFPKHGNKPGINDTFPHGLFHDYNADYWYVTGVPVPAALGGVGIINPAAPPPLGGIGGIPVPDGLVPAGINGGVAAQIAINATVGQTVFIRCLDAAYNFTKITFPLDVIIIEWDGRALGVPPFGNYNAPFTLPAGVPITISTARRFGALMTAAAPTPPDTFAQVDFLDTQSPFPGAPGPRLVTARIPISFTAT